MDKILKEHSTVRIDENGAEVTKPDYWDKWIDKSIPRTGNEPEDWFVQCRKYESYTEVFKLPKFMACDPVTNT